MALQQNDIKRILACSTLSQLGYMVMAVGAGAPNAAMFHLFTHACFKALLFLGAGSAILAARHEQNIWRMGGLLKRMPVTGWTFLIGMLALCGLPPLSGFFSKESALASVLESSLAGSSLLFGAGIAVAALTVLYMLRLFLVALPGQPAQRGSGPGPGVLLGHPPAADPACRRLGGSRLAPGRVLAGRAGAPPPRVRAPRPGVQHSGPGLRDEPGPGPVPEGGVRPPPRPAYPSSRESSAPASASTSAYRIAVILTHESLSRVAGLLDRRLIDGLAVRGLAGFADLSARALRLVQTGHLQTYAFLLLLGMAVLLYLAAGRLPLPAAP